MNTLLICALGLSLVAVVLALIRESRLRRGLEKFVALLLNNWRTRDGEHGVEHDTKRD